MKPNYLVLYKCCHLFSIVTQISKSKRFCLEQSVEHLNMHLDYSYFNCGKDLKSNLFVPVWISNRNPLLWLRRRSISRFFLPAVGSKDPDRLQNELLKFSSCAVSPEDHLAAGPISPKWCCLHFIFVCVHVYVFACTTPELWSNGGACKAGAQRVEVPLRD